MRIIFGFGSKLFVWESSVSKVKMRIAGDPSDQAEEEGGFQQAPPQDPHSTLSSHLELSPQAVFEGAHDTRRFGFGRQKPGS